MFGQPSVYNTLDEAAAARATDATGIAPSKTTVAISRLDSVLQSHLQDKPIELSLIDAEGYDIEIIRSNDFERFRPRVILVEVLDAAYATVTEHKVTTYLTARGYELHAWLNPNLMFVRDDSVLR